MLRLGGSPEVGAIGEEGDGAVIEDATGLITPRGVDCLHRLDAIDATRDDAINERCGVRSSDAVLAHRSHVEERGREADRVILQVVRWEI